jgi:copper(I)-binding protein
VRWLAGILVIALGVAGLIRGAVAQPTVTSTAGGTVVGVDGVVRQVSADTARVSMTIYNTTAQPDRITGAQSGAGAQTTLYRSSIVVPARGSVALTGARALVITQLYGSLRPGQYVNVQLNLQVAGNVLVTARVAASTGSSGSVAPSTPSGVHS